MKRTKHNLSHYHLTSCDMGQIIPISCLETLPGDSFEQQSSALVRVTPQLKPVMHPVTVEIKHFFVPNRILWSGWEDFITGESATPPPTIAGVAHSEGALPDYLGIYRAVGSDYSALPIRAYNKIYNEYFRDTDLQNETPEDSIAIKRALWEKDYFTSARPWPQKGDAVTLPLGTQAPIKGIGYANQTWTTGPQTVYETGESASTSFAKYNTPTVNTNMMMEEDPNNAGYPGVYADLSSAEAVDIRDFREAFAMQRYQEARARYGSRYVDYLRYLGVRPSDSRLQRPEYLGGGRQTISFSEVLNTAHSGGVDPLGEMGGHGIAALRGNRYRRYFEEHGWVLTVLYARPKALYVNGSSRKFYRTTKEDYFQKELEAVGQQEVMNYEIFANHSDPTGTFGYSDRYSEYRTEPSRVSSSFRNSTNYDWHFGRLFGSDPALNETFVTCNPAKRPFAEQTQDALWIMTQNRVVARRSVSRNPMSRII